MEANEHEASTAADPGAPEVPEPPWLRTARPPRARAPLSRDAIVDAALRVLDHHGSPGFSMRRVAQELGSGASALYWHVTNKEQLLQLVLDRVLGELPMPEPDPARWQEQVKQAARDEREMMKRHPGIAELTFGRIPLGPNAILYIEWHLSLLRAGGLSDRTVALAGDLLALYIGAFAFEECVGLAPPSGDDTAPVRDFIGELRAYFASLPPDRFPHITSLATELTSGGPDERFDFGLDVLVAGLLAHSRKTVEDR